MNRKELYNEIISLNLKDEVKAKYGKNYTNCSTAQLQAIVDAVHASHEEVECSCSWSNGPFVKLVEILANKRILLKSEVDEILNA